jgi:hypothetical protein
MIDAVAQILDPHPVSRFVDTDPVKVNSPRSKSIAAQLDIDSPRRHCREYFMLAVALFDTQDITKQTRQRGREAKDVITSSATQLMLREKPNRHGQGDLSRDGPTISSC